MTSYIFLWNFKIILVFLNKCKILILRTIINNTNVTEQTEQ